LPLLLASPTLPLLLFKPFSGLFPLVLLLLLLQLLGRLSGANPPCWLPIKRSCGSLETMKMARVELMPSSEARRPIAASSASGDRARSCKHVWGTGVTFQATMCILSGGEFLEAQAHAVLFAL